MAKINLPSHIVRGLFFALRRISGVRRGPIRHHGHHAQRHSVFERLGPRVRRNAGNGGHGSFGRLFDSAARGIRADAVPRRRWSPIRRVRQASPQELRLQSQPPSPRLGVDGAGPSNAAPPAVEGPAPPVVEAPAPLVEEVGAEPVAAPAYIPMEPMSPAPAPPRYWCDFCKEFALMPHTLEYNYSLPSPTPVTPTTPVATPLHPWYLATQAAPALDAMKVEEEEVVTGPDIGYLINPGGTRPTILRHGLRRPLRTSSCSSTGSSTSDTCGGCSTHGCAGPPGGTPNSD